MRFELTADQRDLRADARAFAESEIRPRAIELDRGETYPAEILDALGDRRWTGLTLPEEHGGRGEGLVELALVVEELAAALMPVASALALHLGVATVVERFGSDAQRADLLDDMATYDTVSALGLTEADAGSDKSRLETTAVRDGDEWVLNGHKQWVTNFRHADLVLTYARTGSGDGVSAFLVPTEAFEVDEVWDTLGARPVKSPRVELSDARVPDDRLVGAEGEALTQRGEVHTGVNVPARGVGVARAALDDTVEYTSSREQHDRHISDFQGVRWRIGEMARRVDTARLLTLRAADRADRGRDVDREFAMAKVHATRAAVDNADEAVQLHGGMGYTTERHVERYLRDAKLLTIAGGPNEGHEDALAEAVIERRQR
ncbi:acyl-CoA dehydrogenase family protein [Halosimplex marinum]|uniref:acyl-CoA dehydrogenase family protein n=1 Tax=Halosimplex marinum TaxID=3396620 RepID=UPI003F57C665